MDPLYAKLAQTQGSEHPVLVQKLTTPHVNRVLQHYRVGARTLIRTNLALDPFSKSQSQLLVRILKPQDPAIPQIDLSVCFCTGIDLGKGSRARSFSIELFSAPKLTNLYHTPSMSTKPIIPGAAHEVKSNEFSRALSDANTSEAGSSIGLARGRQSRQICTTHHACRTAGERE